MMQATTRTVRRGFLTRLRSSDRGEGVISAAIAVLIIALIGAAMWVAFRAMFQNAAERAQDAVDTIADGG